VVRGPWSVVPEPGTVVRGPSSGVPEALLGGVTEPEGAGPWIGPRALRLSRSGPRGYAQSWPCSVSMASSVVAAV
jgi:hypothetical protein